MALKQLTIEQFRLAVSKAIEPIHEGAAEHARVASIRKGAVGAPIGDAYVKFKSKGLVMMDDVIDLLAAFVLAYAEERERAPVDGEGNPIDGDKLWESVAFAVEPVLQALSQA